MTRRRARAKTQEISKSLNQIYEGKNRTFVKVMSHSFFSLLNNAGVTNGAEATVHPNYSLPSGSGIVYTQNNLQGGTNTTYDVFRSIIIKKATYKLRLDNHQGQQVIVNFMRIPFASTGALTANHPYNLCGKLFKDLLTTVTLSKSGETGATKELIVVVEPWKVEGFPSYEHYASNSSYYATNSLRGTNYTNLYSQAFAGDEATALNVGVDVNYDVEFELECRNPNVTLLA